MIENISHYNVYEYLLRLSQNILTNKTRTTLITKYAHYILGDLCRMVPPHQSYIMPHQIYQRPPSPPPPPSPKLVNGNATRAPDRKINVFKPQFATIHHTQIVGGLTSITSSTHYSTSHLPFLSYDSLSSLQVLFMPNNDVMPHIMQTHLPVSTISRGPCYHANYSERGGMSHKSSLFVKTTRINRYL